mgnify:CR=1 FL=1
MTQITERNISCDLLRIAACIGVITIHTAGSPIFHNMVEHGSLWWAECVIIDAFVRWAVPVFVLLTGFFFLNPQKQLPLKKLYGKNILRLVICQIFWTLFYAITLHWHFYPFGDQSSHFWYIGMCIGLYISMPVLRMIAANEKLLAYSCWIWLFIRCYYFIGKFVEVPLVFTDFVFTDYVGYCLWGYYLKTLDFKRWQLNLVYVLGILGLLTNIIVPLVSSVKVHSFPTRRSSDLCLHTNPLMLFLPHLQFFYSLSVTLCICLKE